MFALCLLPMSGGCAIVALVGSSAEMLISNTGVSVRGEVIDVDGQPIHDVPVRVQKSRIARPSADMFSPTPYHYTSETRVVDGRFRFSFPGQASVTLVFKKPGYYQQLVSVESTRRRVDRGSGLPSPAIAPWLVDPKHSNKRSLRVVLENQHQPTQLLTWGQATLSFGKGSRKSGGKAVDFAGQPRWNPPAVWVEDLLDPAQLPARGAYIVASTLDDQPGGPIDWFPIRTRSGSNWASPRRLRLIINGEEGSGFIPVPYLPGVDVLLGMNEAPADGYERELVLDETQLKEMSTAGGFTAHFYFRCGERYGKGRLGIPMVSPDEVRVDAYFFIQPDGSRNLEAINRF